MTRAATSSPRQVRLLEEIAANAWPAQTTEWLHGWRLGFTQGVTRRANSVLPIRWDGADRLDAALDEVESRYRSRGLRPCFKFTSAAFPAGLGRALVARGYRPEGWSDVMTGACGSISVTNRFDGQVGLTDQPPPGWDATCWPERDREIEVPALRALIDRIAPPHVFALAKRDGQPVGTGLAVHERGQVGVTAINVHPDFRRTGVARAVLGALARWADRQGAASLYLQVDTDNAPARRLYLQCGFNPAYRYHYRAI